MVPRTLPQFAAETLNKPESYISVSYLYQEHLTFAGSFDPAFLLYIVSISVPPSLLLELL